MKTNFGKIEYKSYELGKRFFEKKWNDERIRIHSECVIETCLHMIINTHLHKEILIIAGWIHDLGRKIEKENHHIISLDALKEFLLENKELNIYEKELEDCIKNHRSNGKQKTIYGLIFKCADKIALHHNKWLKYKEEKKT